MKNVTRAPILALPVKYPSAPEQRRIAATCAKHAQLAQALVAQAAAV